MNFVGGECNGFNLVYLFFTQNLLISCVGNLYSAENVFKSVHIYFFYFYNYYFLVFYFPPFRLGGGAIAVSVASATLSSVSSKHCRREVGKTSALSKRVKIMFYTVLKVLKSDKIRSEMPLYFMIWVY